MDTQHVAQEAPAQSALDKALGLIQGNTCGSTRCCNTQDVSNQRNLSACVVTEAGPLQWHKIQQTQA